MSKAPKAHKGVGKGGSGYQGKRPPGSNSSRAGSMKKKETPYRSK